MKADWEIDIILNKRSQEMAIPSVNLVEPRSEIFHWDFSSDLKQFVLSMDEEAVIMLLMWTAKIVVRMLEEWW